MVKVANTRSDACVPAVAMVTSLCFACLPGCVLLKIENVRFSLPSRAAHSQHHGNQCSCFHTHTRTTNMWCSGNNPLNSATGRSQASQTIYQRLAYPPPPPPPPLPEDFAPITTVREDPFSSVPAHYHHSAQAQFMAMLNGNHFKTPMVWLHSVSRMTWTVAYP